MILPLTDSAYINRKYGEFYDINGYLPNFFQPYDCKEITDYAPTLTAKSNTSTTHTGTVLIFECRDEE